jgi:hypothetical protein
MWRDNAAQYGESQKCIISLSTKKKKMEIEHSSTQPTIYSGMGISAVASVLLSHSYLRTIQFLVKFIFDCGKRKLFLCLSNDHAMKTHGEVEV